MEDIHTTGTISQVSRVSEDNLPENKSLAVLPLLTLCVGLAIGGAAGFFFAKSNLIPAPLAPIASPAPEDDFVACTQEAMQCPDGSYVGRSGPSCEFEACPTSDPKKLTLAIYVYQSDETGAQIADSPQMNMFLTLPENGTVIQDTTSTGIPDTVELDGTRFSISSSDRAGGGLCPMEADASECTYSDEQFPNSYGLRIWKDKKGVFALSLANLSIDKYMIPVIMIAKPESDKNFTSAEVEQWKEILKSVEIEESPGY